jgi:MFS family permease
MDAAALERLTSRRYLQGMVFQGIWTTGQFMFPFVLAKSLHAPGWLVTLSVMMETSGMMLGLYWGQLMASGGRRRWLFWGGLGGRLVTIAALLVHSAGAFVVMLAVVYFFISLVYPAQNSILQDNVPPERRGALFGRGARVQFLTAAACSYLLGVVLEQNPDNFRYTYPILGVLGFGYPLLLSRLPRPEGHAAGADDRVFVVPRLALGPVQWRRLAVALVLPFRQARDTFARDRQYLWYETNFMIYGVAFIMLIPVIPLYYIEVWDLRYQAIAQSRVMIGSIGMALLGPLAGRLMDRVKPARLCALSFGWVTLFPLTLALGPDVLPLRPEHAAYLAFAIYSVGMAGVNVGWNVGSIAFAPPGQGAHYQGIHVAMVGLRGAIAPVVGYVTLRIAGYREVFLVAAGLFAAAALSSWLLARYRSR